MSNQIWLSLTEYSTKYNVSISTLRRRIKSGELPSRLDDGKYYLKDTPNMVTQAPPHSFVTPVIPTPPAPEEVNPLVEENAPSIAVTANKLLNELKKAYALILQEKEEQVLQLRDEVADLKTLVRVLEEEIQRLKSVNETFKPSSNSGQEWLDL